MNCKPGDLAVVMRSRRPENVGRIVRVVGPYPSHGVVLDAEPGDYLWEIECRPYVGMNRSMPPVAADSQLRPIRDPGDDARDETLDWLSVPADKVPA